MLKYGPDAEEEWPRVLDALSVPETYFWREMDQIRALVDVLLPQFFSSLRTEPLRIWSAACATGEEPLTLAMALTEAGWFESPRSNCSLAMAALRQSQRPAAACIGNALSGVSRLLCARNISARSRTAGRSCPNCTSGCAGRLPNLAVRAEVGQFLPAAVIFCRNVFIYFSGDTITRTVRLFSEGMPRAGYLFVGVSESLLKYTTDFELREIGGAFAYVRR